MDDVVRCDAGSVYFYHGTSREFAELLVAGRSPHHPFLDEATRYLHAAVSVVLNVAGSVSNLIRLVDRDEYRDLDVNLYAVQQIVSGNTQGSWTYGNLYVTSERVVAERYARRTPELLWIIRAFETFQLRLTGRPLLTVAGYDNLATILERPHRPAIAVFVVNPADCHIDRDGKPVPSHVLRDKIEWSNVAKARGSLFPVELRLPPGARAVSIEVLA